jgi:hypothetical protein
MAFTHILATGMLPETMTQCRRIVADGGTIVDQKWMDRTIRTLKAQGIYTSSKFLGDANFAYKNATGVTTLYDISGNNNDAIQATTARQPIWTAGVQNGRAGLVYDGTNDTLTVAAHVSLDITAALTVGSYVKTGATYEATFRLIKKGYTYNTTEYMIHNELGYWRVHIVIGVEKTSKGTTALQASTNYAVMGTYDGAALNLYVNNVLEKTNPVTGSINAGTGEVLQLGGIDDWESAQYQFKGTKYHDHIFNAALTDAQRNALNGLVNSYYAIY